MRKRQQQIIKYINDHVLAGVDELAETFGVSAMTIRRDIDYLAKISLLKKIKGGAQVLEKPDIIKEAELFARINTNITIKSAICCEAFSLIRPGQSVFIDGSTTLLPLFKLIAEKKNDMTVVTNSVLACLDLAKARNVRVISVGGNLDSETMCFMGADVQGWMDSFAFDVAFFSSAAFEPDEGTFESSTALMPLKRMIAKRSNKVVYVADSTKFGNRALIKVLDISILNTIVTDNGLSVHFSNQLKKQGIEVRIANISNV